MISIVRRPHRLHAMLDCVLDQRLQRKDRYDRLQHVRIDLDAYRQSILEPGLLQAQVLLYVMQFLRERDVRALSLERVPGELCELRE